MSHYSDGARFEREVIQIMKDNGFDCVRAAGSKGKLAGYDCDVICTKQTGQTKYEVGLVMMQMKRTKLKRRVKAAGYQ